jgi:negative regulator of replication initiation
MSKQRPLIDPAAFRAVCAYAVEHAILPEDVIRIAARIRPREPFLIEPSELSPSFSHGRRYLSLLAALYRGNRKLFDDAAPKIHGTVRTYFGHTANEVESTGNSNYASAIPDSPWFASVNNSDEKRAQTADELMRAMGFSYDYSKMISDLCIRREVRLPSSYSNALARLPSA